MISTRGRYALRVMIELANNTEGKYIPMKDVAEKQGISLKYLEQIMPILTKRKFVEAVHGKGGGYRLTRKPEEYCVGDILRLTETTLAPIACLSEDSERCSRADTCPTLDFWKGLNDVTNQYVDRFTLADFIK